MMPPPIVIAHRGASGYLPEHTLAAKALAHGFGADYLEQDVVATRDSQLVVLHDVYLDDVTDIARRFPGRSRADGRFYVVDFELAELKTLTVFERRAPGSFAARYPARFPPDAGLFGIATLREELELIRGLNRSTGRVAGIYPEIKEPAWHRKHGIDLAQLLLAELRAFGYSKPEHAVFVQCFDQAELLRVRNELGCALQLIQLMGPEPEYAALSTPVGLACVASYANGIGPHYSQLIEATARPTRPSDVMRSARDAGLRVHAYTFRQDDLPAYARSLESLLEMFLGEVGVDGVFCDHPDVAIRVRDSLRKVQIAPSLR
jgi:glycerophosphoryl diester phosphodiesterase